MKYWKDSDIQHIKYEEGGRILPYKYPASITTSNTRRIEMEIIPGTSEVREHISPHTFEMEKGMCVKMERRTWRNNNPMFTEVFWVPIDVLGYDEEPDNYASYELAMEII